MKWSGIVVCCLFVVLGCTTAMEQTQNSGVKQNSQHLPRTLTGIEVLRNNHFNLLKGKRVGLITNPTGVDANLKSTVDILHEATQVQLVALFAPEHGVRGDFSAGDAVGNATDPSTGLPVFSLYGKTKKPTAQMLKGIDVLVYDIQDIGVRSYTFISTLGLAMEAAAENGIEFMVLDRPNPLGGNRVEGPLVEPEYKSFVSQYSIPYVYGLTAGELAKYLNDKGLLSNGVQCHLTVVALQNWERSMSFSDTQLPWVPTSPHIPRANSAYFYALSGIVGELDPNMIGVGYTLPFEIFATPFADAQKLADALNAFQLSGLRVRPIYFKPYYMANKGMPYAGVQVFITDYNKVRITEVQFRFLEALHILYPEKNVFDLSEQRLRMFDLVCGSSKIRTSFCQNYKYDDIKVLWEGAENSFRLNTKAFYLYP